MNVLSIGIVCTVFCGGVAWGVGLSVAVARWVNSSWRPARPKNTWKRAVAGHVLDVAWTISQYCVSMRWPPHVAAWKIKAMRAAGRALPPAPEDPRGTLP